MRQLINSTYTTLDGVVEGPHLWPALKGGTSDEGATIQTDLLETCDIVLMGRRTYDVFAPAWSSRSGDPYSDRINTMRKVVVSTTLTDPAWDNTEVIASDVVDRVQTLRGRRCRGRAGGRGHRKYRSRRSGR
jgi:dihydrofolate reductase